LRQQHDRLPIRGEVPVGLPGFSLHVPFNAFGVRDISTVPAWALIPPNTHQPIESSLLSWSVCLQSGAQLLTGLKDNYHLPRVCRLPVVEITSETAPAPPADPSFGGPAGPIFWATRGVHMSSGYSTVGSVCCPVPPI
jgi:hypothetical protein